VNGLGQDNARLGNVLSCVLMRPYASLFTKPGMCFNPLRTTLKKALLGRGQLFLTSLNHDSSRPSSASF
jgi:hypothetical protein